MQNLSVCCDGTSITCVESHVSIIQKPEKCTFDNTRHEKVPTRKCAMHECVGLMLF